MDRTKKIALFTTSIISFLLAYTAKPILAITKPNFPSCLNPNAQLIVSYNSGIHGVPGQTARYEGEDKVYQLSDGNALQCLCTVNGDGIHTNWWRVSSLTEEELISLRADGWILVPDGSLWGLEKTTYMAQNIFYSCKSSGGSSSSSSSDNGIGGGDVQGISTRFGQVLGLATTGTLPTIASYLGLGIACLLLSSLLKK